MSVNYGIKSRHIGGYPGDGYHYVICDVCGKKMRARDATKITDKYNTLNNMVVCKADADKTNPQTYIRSRREREVSNPSMIRSEGADRFVFIDSADEITTGDTSNPSGTAPSAVRNLTIHSATSSTVELIWQGPESSGTSAPSGYQIERESPVGGGFSTLAADTDSVASYYKDTTVSAGTQYNYRVSAINRAGTGAASNEAAVTTGS